MISIAAPTLSSRTPVARKTCVNVRAQNAAPSARQEKKQVIKVAVAGLAAAAMLMANSPAAFADEDEVKQRICAAQPTAKICLANSAKSS